MALPADQVPVGEGLHPDGSPGADFFVDRLVLESLEEDGPASKYEDARFIEEAVGQPDAIFEGLQRENMQDRLCYSVRLTRDPEDEDNPLPPRFGVVFLVFVRPGAWGYVVFDWDWRTEDGDTPGHPENWQEDFTRRTWRKT